MSLATGISVLRSRREGMDLYQTPPVAVEALLQVERTAAPDSGSRHAAAATSSTCCAPLVTR